MANPIQMEMVTELKFPKLSFSPLATSSPKLTKMRVPIHERSFTSSDESSGNVTMQAVAGVDESHLETSKVFEGSSTSLHTAIEYIFPEALQNKKAAFHLTRENLRTAIIHRKMEDETLTEDDVIFYATVVTERILWSNCRIWNGSISLSSEDTIEEVVDFACDNWYMSNTVQLCVGELRLVDENDNFDWNAVATYCYDKGMPYSIIQRIFTKNLVRKTTGDCLDIAEMVWVIFAIVGTDEQQTFEYWFRVLDVQCTGVLSFTDLHEFYEDITEILADKNVTSLPFDSVIAQYCDILNTNKWTLQSFKKNALISGRVINGFVNAYRFLEQELDEKVNAERVDDENFGEGKRTKWQRLIDHKYDKYYLSRSTSSASNSSDLSDP
ncbi:unnamed protein product [Caenorhabditis sp. 36 PRJEB53466]|nr:unnamed protein product [Caenorhabditis sp. 36 PRJEB53466]